MSRGPQRNKKAIRYYYAAYALAIAGIAISVITQNGTIAFIGGMLLLGTAASAVSMALQDRQRRDASRDATNRPDAGGSKAASNDEDLRTDAGMRRSIENRPCGKCDKNGYAVVAAYRVGAYKARCAHCGFSRDFNF